MFIYLLYRRMNNYRKPFPQPTSNRRESVLEKALPYKKSAWANSYNNNSNFFGIAG
jgi:hypothetical protein